MIKGFIHCYATDRGKEITYKQIDKLTASPLWELTEHLYLGVVGEKLLIDNDKITQIVTSENRYEGHTLAILYQKALASNFLTYYMHSKGASHLDDNAESWRSFMEDSLIDYASICIKALSIVDTVGPLGIVTKPYNFYAGNFWWSKASYIRTLVDPYTWAKAAYTERKSEERWAYETWITQTRKCNYLFLSSGEHLLPSK